MKAAGKGEQIHDEILRRGLLEESTALGNALLDMYVKCGQLAKAREALEALHARNAISWSTLISGYAHQGHGFEALGLFERMQRERVSPDEIAYTCALKACSLVGALEKGKEIHDEVVKERLLEKSVVLGNSLVDMYAKCGMLAKAQQVLEELPVRDVVTWSTLIAGYARREEGQKALDCFERMQREGLRPNAVTLVCALNACAITGSIGRGEEIHEEIVARGLLERHVGLANALVDMYSKCGDLEKARRVLDELPARDVVTWNALIVGYAHRGQGQKALECFEQMMQREKLSPNEITFACVMKACANPESIDAGERIHKEIVDRGLLKQNLLVGTALVDMYCKCGMLGKARRIADGLRERDLVCWNALIAGYARQEDQGSEALACFERMQRESLSPDHFTFASVLKVCGNMRAAEMGRRMHEEIATRALLDESIVLGNALEDMYIKCGAFAEARYVLDHLPVRDIVSWNTLLLGYAQHEQGHEALNCFTRMEKEGLTMPNEVTFICVLKACSSVGAADKGIEIHSQIVGGEWLEKSSLLGTALVDMYAKFSMFARAYEVLQQLPTRDAVSWNALIAGYSREGFYDESLRCIEQMEREGLSPNEATFLCILNACSHGGQWDKAQIFYENMSGKYRLMPKLEHQACIVTVYGNAGEFGKAMSVIETMPSSDNPTLWLSLLGSCRKWGNVELGRLAFERAIRLDSNLAAAYVLMVNIYVSAGMHEDAQKVEKLKAGILPSSAFS
jgi:pentatricopeptide repeat protein